MKLNEITQNERALRAFGGNGQGNETVELTDSSNGRTYSVDGGRWFFFSSDCGSDAVSETGEEGTWKVMD